MSTVFLYGICGAIAFVIGLHGVIAARHLLRKAIAANIMSTGIFIFLVALANRNATGIPDPVPHGMVLTGIVVAVSATAFVLVLIVRYFEATGKTELDTFDNISGEEDS